MNKYLLGGVVAGFFFGTAAIFIRALGGFPSISIAFWRLLIGGLILALISYTLKLESKIVTSELKLASLMGVLLAFHFIFFIQAVKDTSVINATTLVNTSPIQAAIISALIFKIPPTRLSLASVILGFLGALIMGGGEGVRPHTIGDVEALIAGTLIALYANVGRLARGEREVKALPFMYKVYFVAALTVLVISSIVGEFVVTPYTLKDTLMLLGLGLIPTGVGHTLIVFSLRSLKAHEAETLALLEPASASTLAFIIFGEVPSTVSLVGFVFIGASIMLLSFSLVREES